MSSEIGRPSVYTPEVGEEICTRLIAGESLRGICESAHLPDASTVYRWLARGEPEEFCKQYTRAREAQADTLFDDTLEIADDARNDWMVRRGEEDAGWVANGEHIQRSRLRIDTRKWMAGKLAPKKYGESQMIKHAGHDGGDLVASLMETINGDGRPRPGS